MKNRDWIEYVSARFHAAQAREEPSVPENFCCLFCPGCGRQHIAQMPEPDQFACIQCRKVWKIVNVIERAMLRARARMQDPPYNLGQDSADTVDPEVDRE